MTAQMHEKLILDGEETSMACTPSIPKHFRIKELPKGHGINHTACWRHYVGTWELREKRLYLNQIEGIYKLLGDKPLFADWYSGTLRIPVGSMVHYEHMGFASEYENELYIKIRNGVEIHRVDHPAAIQSLRRQESFEDGHIRQLSAIKLIQLASDIEHSITTLPLGLELLAKGEITAELQNSVLQSLKKYNLLDAFFPTGLPAPGIFILLEYLSDQSLYTSERHEWSETFDSSIRRGRRKVFFTETATGLVENEEIRNSLIDLEMNLINELKALQESCRSKLVKAILDL